MSLKSLVWKEKEDPEKGLITWCEDDPINFEDDCSNIYSKAACL